MSTILDSLQQLHSTSSMGLMTHIVLGYPDYQTTEDLLDTMVSRGVHFIEIQIPFSDPMADGPTIMHANTVALQGGARTEDVFELLKKYKNSQTSFLVMCYYNTIFHYGVEEFCKKLHGICSGIIVPDYPLLHDDTEGLAATANKYGIELVRVLSPASNQDRVEKNIAASQNLLYFAGRKGITGTQSQLSTELAPSIQMIRHSMQKADKNTSIAVGFGISHPDHVRQLHGLADVVVIGSKVIQVFQDTGIAGVSAFLQEIMDALIQRA